MKTIIEKESVNTICPCCNTKSLIIYDDGNGICSECGEIFNKYETRPYFDKDSLTLWNNNFYTSCPVCWNLICQNSDKIVFCENAATLLLKCNCGSEIQRVIFEKDVI